MAPPSSPADPAVPEFINPAVADHISNPPENHLKTFVFNLVLVTAALVAVIVAINFAATSLTPCIPFEWERDLLPASAFEITLDEGAEARQTELRRIGDRLAGAMDLPSGMSVRIFYNPALTVNAFATLGGNIVVFQGLLDLMESEDELAMVLAHEIGHIKNRDAVKGVVRAVGLSLLMAGLNDSGGYVNGVMGVGISSYSRAQEEAADREAVRALGAVYGHAGGAARFFTSLAEKVEKRSADAPAPFFSGLSATHPDTLRRLALTREEADRLHVPRDGDRTPLSTVFH